MWGGEVAAEFIDDNPIGLLHNIANGCILTLKSVLTRNYLLRVYSLAPLEGHGYRIHSKFLFGVTCYGLHYRRTDGRTYGQRDVEVEILF